MHERGEEFCTQFVFFYLQVSREERRWTVVPHTCCDDIYRLLANYPWCTKCRASAGWGGRLLNDFFEYCWATLRLIMLWLVEAWGASLGRSRCVLRVLSTLCGRPYVDRLSFRTL